MRRPVKPFVTEYRPSGRRGKEGLSEESRPPRNGAATDRRTEAHRGNLAPRDLFRPAADATDSHEAAMRAADALFSPRAEPGAAVPDAAEVEAPRMTRAQASGTEPTGRVLQALDEPESEAAAAVSEEPAPRRRSRAPGSARKPASAPAPRRAGRHRPATPSIPQTAVEAAAHSMGEADPVRLATAVAMPDTPTMIEALRDDAGAEEVSSPVAQAAGPDRGKVVVVARRREPFAWVRTKLRPGEQWKRRLPKVAW